MPDLRQQLETCLRGRVCLMGLGNVDYGDDGFGVRLAESLVFAGVPDAMIVGNMPDRYIGIVAEQDFDNVVFLDAVEFGGAPGSLVLLACDEIVTRFPQVSTHKISIGLLAQWVESNGKTKAWLLGVQPECVKRTEGLSPSVRAARDALRDLLLTFTLLTKPQAERAASEVRVP